ncbi:peptidylprolyl isomerase [Hydrogenimonas cancrithermarum]|uniref:Peptidyl-prolyl cis-trans isomerase n=1 Tax=Hydrogenimonas cancrithermarum TaxID=2993563 RepID=A0ABN6WYK1_9BACT|nr:peptidylprolyl isomerase [Hydrogenimonas cancrithermarum]BDY13364.1 peptidyl-prolyl cis-trans isomerase [Hydrogenimonas cancrithermarum]
MKRLLAIFLFINTLVFAQQSGTDAETQKHPLVKLQTNMGDIVLEIRSDWAPLASENFLQHVKEGYYDGVPFHRIIRGFMIQGGDPTGTGRGGDSIWHKPFRDEFAPNVVFDRPGILAMANAGPNTNRSQFFITVGRAPWLNGHYTIFGVVKEGMETVYNISKVSTDRRDRPRKPVKIIKATPIR